MSKINKKYKKVEKELALTKVNNTILLDWLYLRQNDIQLANWLRCNRIETVAIYGYGILGKALYKELINSKVEVVCIIDRNYQNIHADVKVVSIDKVPLVDAIIISVVNYYDEIEAELFEKCTCTIVSLEDIVYGVGYKYEE